MSISMVMPHSASLVAKYFYRPRKNWLILFPSTLIPVSSRLIIRQKINKQTFRFGLRVLQEVDWLSFSTEISGFRLQDRVKLC